MKKITMYTDGACKGNPGPGGFGTILRYKSTEKEISGGESSTTNNRMELTAVIKGLEALKESCQVDIYTDSKYVCDAVSKGWAVSWKRNGWKKSDKKPALNSDLWGELLELIDKHECTFHWIKGHNGHPENERCDSMAVKEAEKFVKK